MGDLTIKRGNLAINYGSLSTYNGTSTWTLKHGYDNNLTFITDGDGAAVFSNLSITAGSFSSAGLVSIGAPQTTIGANEKFQIYNSVDCFGAIRDGTSTLVLGSFSGTPFIGSYNNVNMSFRQNNRQVMALVDNGTGYQPSLLVDSGSAVTNNGDRPPQSPLRVVGRVTGNAVVRSVASFEQTGGGAVGAITRVGISSYPPGSNYPGAAIDAVDQGDYQSKLSFKTKKPGSAGNALYDRMTLSGASDGSSWAEISCTGAGTSQAAVTVITANNRATLGSVNAAWSVAGGGDWEILNGGAAYIVSDSVKGISYATQTGPMSFLTGGYKNTNIRGYITSAGNWGIGSWGGSVPVPDELMVLKNGNLKLEGEDDIHGIIFPNGSMQKKAAWVSNGPRDTITSINTSNADMTLGFDLSNYCEQLDPTHRLINIAIQCDGVGDAGTGDVIINHNMSLPFGQNINGTLSEDDVDGNIYHVIWNTGSSKLMYLNGAIYSPVTPTTPLVFSDITVIQLNGIVTVE